MTLIDAAVMLCATGMAMDWSGGILVIRFDHDTHDVYSPPVFWTWPCDGTRLA